ncbi:MAG: hypothetical protein ABIS50_14565 [Luteolibacter sp.]|uniref:hypothetical protein n=1 Tax=Luteolibacter sp. TaxID=1962973 RepID=UPI003266DA68
MMAAIVSRNAMPVVTRICMFRFRANRFCVACIDGYCDGSVGTFICRKPNDSRRMPLVEARGVAATVCPPSGVRRVSNRLEGWRLIGME